MLSALCQMSKGPKNGPTALAQSNLALCPPGIPKDPTCQVKFRSSTKFTVLVSDKGPDQIGGTLGWAASTRAPELDALAMATGKHICHNDNK